MSVKILMVCLGNICRSPLAEGILASKLPANQFFVDSAGTGPWHVGDAPDKRSIAVAENHSVSIANQKGRQFSTKDFDTFDYIYVMDTSNYGTVIEMAQDESQRNKVQLILNELFPNKNKSVPDPYYGTAHDFEQVYQMLDEVCEVIAHKLKSKHK